MVASAETSGWVTVDDVSVVVSGGSTNLVPNPDFDSTGGGGGTLTAPTLVAATAGSYDGDGSPTIALPSGIQSGDVIVAHVGSKLADAAYVTGWDGYTEIHQGTYDGYSTSTAYTIATGSDTDPEFVLASSWQDQIVTIQVWRGVDTANPIGADVGSADSSAWDTALTLTGVTTVSDESIVAAFAYGNSINGITPPSGWTETTETAGSSKAGTSAYGTYPAAGATGNVTFTRTSSQRTAAGSAIALNPTPAGGGGGGAGTWTWTGDTSYPASSGVTDSTGVAAGRTGNGYALSNVASSTITSDGFAVTAGSVYDVSVWARGETATSGDAGSVTVMFKDVSGTVISTITAATIDSATLSTTWTQYTGQVTAPTGATDATVTTTSTETSGWVTFDDASFGDSGAISASETWYYTNNGAVVAMTVDGVFSHVFTDHLGSPHTTWTPTTGDIKRQLSNPYGTQRYTDDLDTDIGFTGQYQDPSGLSFYNARYYDPTVGRFVSPDTVVPNPLNPQDLNRYTYVGNNPATYTDPTGNCATSNGTIIDGFDTAPCSGPSNGDRPRIFVEKLVEVPGPPTFSSVASGSYGVETTKEPCYTCSAGGGYSELVAWHLGGGDVGEVPDVPYMPIEMRQARNRASYKWMTVARAAGGACSAAGNRMFSCLLPQGTDLSVIGDLPARGGTTFGEVFLTTDRVNHESMLGSSAASVRLQFHEETHAIQWAIHGGDFAALYVLDGLLAGNSGREQFYEIQANLSFGGY